ncbi:hypothetical protein BJ878DRAFT_6191 [Calycina marina]|uniref:BHLH domain-containing protein n=1 Tax=Calycina marina TaxID=1763456 RepID=A0A9P7Z5U5_9HELO|nr:hypothetical protein BJ878DRAFT_6191 [Calycina marina]
MTRTNMEPIRNYFSVSENKRAQRSSWEVELPSPWESNTPADMPIWRYTSAALHHGGPQIAYYIPEEVPISPYSDPRAGPSTVPSPITVFTHDGRFTPLTSTPTYDTPTHRQTQSPNQFPRVNVPQTTVENTESDEVMEGEDWEGCVREVNRSSTSPPSASARKKSHRRSQYTNEDLLKNAKRAHTVVERNYRERLNDKIADLALYLFETSSDSCTKPSKSLVMTRAKERLKQLEARNKALESEVTKLKQRIAILDHVVASKGGVSTPILAPVNTPASL